MKSIVKSQLIGKWYQIAKGKNRCEESLVEVMLYLSVSCDDDLDLLYVGVRNDGTKKLRELSLKIPANGDSDCLLVRSIFFRKKLKILTFDIVNGLMVISDRRKRYFSILSRKPTVNHNVVESCLSGINFLKSNDKEIKLYSNNIV